MPTTGNFKKITKHKIENHIHFLRARFHSTLFDTKLRQSHFTRNAHTIYLPHPPMWGPTHPAFDGVLFKVWSDCAPVLFLLFFLEAYDRSVFNHSEIILNTACGGDIKIRQMMCTYQNKCYCPPLCAQTPVLFTKLVAACTKGFIKPGGLKEKKTSGW